MVSKAYVFARFVHFLVVHSEAVIGLCDRFECVMSELSTIYMLASGWIAVPSGISLRSLLGPFISNPLISSQEVFPIQLSLGPDLIACALCITLGFLESTDKN